MGFCINYKNHSKIAILRNLFRNNILKKEYTLTLLWHTMIAGVHCRKLITFFLFINQKLKLFYVILSKQKTLSNEIAYSNAKNVKNKLVEKRALNANSRPEVVGVFHFTGGCCTSDTVGTRLRPSF